MGDGEMDEPESLGAIALAAREQLDNLIFVVNCNLQRLDGPVRGNGKIIQELEADFRGAGWNVIKVIWGSNWDALLARDKNGLLRKRMEECVDGEYQAFKSRDGAYVRKRVFQQVSRAARDGLGHDRRGSLAAAPRRPRSDQSLRRLCRRGRHRGQPTVILAKTIKGYGMGAAGEGMNITHQQKKMDWTDAQGLSRPVPDSGARRQDRRASRCIGRPTTASKSSTSSERREALGGSLPQRRRQSSRSKCRRCRLSSPSSKSTERSRDFDHDGVRADSLGPGARQKHRQARRADRARRIAHLRHGRDVPPARNFLAGRPALQAGGRRPIDVLPRASDRARSCRKASTKPARCRRGSPRPPPTARTTCR